MLILASLGNCYSWTRIGVDWVDMDQFVSRALSRLSMIRVAIMYGAAGVGAALLIGAAAITVSPRQAQATPAYGAQTGRLAGGLT